MKAIRSRVLAFVLSGCAAPSGVRAGDTGIYHNGIYLPPKLPAWGRQHPENNPTKYTIGDMGHEFVNGRLMFFIVKEIDWNPVTHEPKYVKVPALGVKS